mgnify:CR=1 FL=1
MHKQQFEADMRPDEIKADCLRAITQQDVSTNKEISLKVFGSVSNNSIRQIKMAVCSLHEDNAIKHTRGECGVDEWWLFSTVVPKKRGFVNTELVVAMLSEGTPVLSAHAVAGELFEEINPAIISRVTSTLNQMCKRDWLLKHNIDGLSYFALLDFKGDFNDYKTESPKFKLRSKSAPGYKEAPEVVLKRSQLMNQAMEFHKVMANTLKEMILNIVIDSKKALSAKDICSELYRNHDRYVVSNTVNRSLIALFKDKKVSRVKAMKQFEGLAGGGSTPYYKYQSA